MTSTAPIYDGIETFPAHLGFLLETSHFDVTRGWKGEVRIFSNIQSGDEPAALLEREDAEKFIEHMEYIQKMELSDYRRSRLLHDLCEQAIRFQDMEPDEAAKRASQQGRIPPCYHHLIT
ncbi:hypothetical protein [Aureimonas psammosilenae]|uniref:hypothetical protein n=1 Tax=Aureimonas psammosilenae TaxID=2495496 RepID=UPI001260C9CD|nr:hypothetical protein [Aureimonas psammosilenae]